MLAEHGSPGCRLHYSPQPSLYCARFMRAKIPRVTLADNASDITYPDGEAMPNAQRVPFRLCAAPPLRAFAVGFPVVDAAQRAFLYVREHHMRACVSAPVPPLFFRFFQASLPPALWKCQLRALCE